MSKEMKMTREKIKKDDGRYLIYYSFTDESEIGQSSIVRRSQKCNNQKQEEKQEEKHEGN